MNFELTDDDDISDESTLDTSSSNDDNVDDDSVDEARNAGTGDSGVEDRNNPGTGDSERLSSMLVSCSFMTEVGDMSLFRLLLVLITMVSLIYTVSIIICVLNGICNAASNNSLYLMVWSATICDQFCRWAPNAISSSNSKIRASPRRNQ